MTKFTAIVKFPESLKRAFEDVNIEEISIKNSLGLTLTRNMLAFDGKRLNFSPISSTCFQGKDHAFDIAWLQDFRKECNPGFETLELDAKVLVPTSENVNGKRYFAKFENGKVYVFADGATSWSTNGTLAWFAPEEVSLAEE